ncbi:MAG: hypothetical protein FWF15_08250 [Oscillospiraceae bacterium]|nr:hypothetical protein [Oscillospiraceae bacterium]
MINAFAVNIASAQNFEVNSGGGILLHWKGEQISYWNGGFSYKNNRNFVNKLDILQINSDMSQFSGKILKIGYSVELDLGKIRSKLSAGYLEQSKINVLLGTKKITSGGAEGFYIGASPGFNIQKATIKPSVLFAGLKFKEGDFNFFYGKPDIPKFLHWGLSGEYDKKHEISFSVTNFDLNIVNNDDMPLFISSGRVLGSSYKYTNFDDNKLKKFSGSVGMYFADLSMNGSLTPANQRYFLFPFDYFNLDGNLDANIGHAIFDYELRRKYLTHSFKIGVLNVFSGEVNAKYHSKYRKFFGTSEKNESLDPIILKNTGFGFLAYSFETPAWTINNKIHVDFRMRKIIACPWGFDKFMSGKDDGIFDQIEKKDLIKTILFSGLSGSLSIMF